MHNLGVGVLMKENREKPRPAPTPVQPKLEKPQLGMEQLIQRGEQLTGDNDYKGAVMAFNEAREMARKAALLQTDLDLSLRMINLLFELGEYKQCREESLAFTKSKLFDYYPGVICANIANCSFMLGEYEDAIKWFDKALESNPNDSRHMTTKGEALLRLGRMKEAEDCFTKILNDVAGAAVEGPYMLRGLAKAFQGNPEEGMADVQKAIDSLPKYFRGYMAKGVIEAGEDKFEEAAASFQTALQFHPDSKKAKEWLEASKRKEMLRFPEDFPTAI